MNDRIHKDFRLVNEQEKLLSKEIDILEKNNNFFSSNSKYVDEMLKIINAESNISIRVLDWFVANYSKKNNTCYKISVNNKKEFFYVNNEYKNQLNGYSKLYFDPFCRKRKVIYTYRSQNRDKKVVFLTSIGQLNFFQWAIKNKVIKHVELHIKEIEDDMKETSRKNKERKAILSQSDNSSNEQEITYSDDPDPLICSSDTIHNIHIISPIKKNSLSKSDSDGRNKRQQLSKSVYDNGIKKINIPIRLDFD